MRLHCRHRSILLVLVIIVAFIVLPTGTPEDFFTTFLIIKIWGWKVYLALLVITYLAYKWSMERCKR